MEKILEGGREEMPSTLRSLAVELTEVISPLTCGGIMILCSGSSSFSKTVPKTSPPETWSPARKRGLGVNCQCLVRDSEGTSTPLGMNTSPDILAMSLQGGGGAGGIGGREKGR